jgi:hypothetical protein
MRGAILAATFLLTPLSVAASAADPPEKAAERSEQASAEREKRICRVDKATGSLTRRTRVCMTRAQWQELHGRTKKGMDEFVSGASGGCRAPDNVMSGTMC